MTGKIFGCLRKLWDIRGNFLICAEKFLHVCRIYAISVKKFLRCPGKKILCPPPLARQQFWGEILIRHGRAKTVLHKTRLGPSTHGEWLTTRMQLL
jgi:hypothetical protein